MKLSDYFISHPKFAWVIAILMILTGTIAIFVLPVSQYPQITPPQIIVRAEYPGANAQTLIDTVAVPIENQLNGVDGMLYMSSTATDSGVYTLTITFNIGVNPDIAQVKVENRLEQAKPLLPAIVTQEGLSVTSESANILAFLILESPNKTYDSLYLSNYAFTNLQNPLERIAGISNVNIYGPQNSVRIWLNPQKMALYNLNTNAVVEAIESQNSIAGIGALGSAPSQNGKLLLSLTTKGLLSSVEDFENIILSTNQQGGIVYLKDVANIEIGADSYNLNASYNNAPSVAIALSQTPDSNALEIMDNVKKEIKVLTAAFDGDMEFKIAYDSTLFVRDSIQGILYTLLLTFALVIGVVYLFLQDWKATLIPTISIPVSLIATFMVIYAIGFDINILTLFALILAIGLVVDDAIIVVERVQYLIKFKKMDSFKAAFQAMSDIGSSIIATTFVLLSIFIPVGLMAGITGKIYQQFAITISTAVLFSAVNALTLSPALCAIFLRPKKQSQKSGTFFGLFNRFLDKSQSVYLACVGFLCHHIKTTLVITVCVICFIAGLFKVVPSSFIPEEDQGLLLANIQLPTTATFNQTEELLAEISRESRKIDGVDYFIGIAGNSLLSASGENIGMAAIGLKPWDERTTKELSIESITQKLTERFANNPHASIEFFALPAIPGVGNSSGLSFQLNALNNKTTPDELFLTLEKLLGYLNTNDHFEFAFSSFQSDTPHLYLDINRERLAYYQVPISNVFNALENYFGSRYVNNITVDGQINKVIVQADYNNRHSMSDLEYLYVPSTTGQLVQLKDFVTFKTVMSPKIIYRYNQYTSAGVTAQTAAHVSTGTAIADIQKFVPSLGNQYGIAWTGISLQEVETAGLAVILIAFAFVFSYLFLVALYESFWIAFAVILTNIFAILGALLGLYGSGLPLTIYAQLGIVLLIGLASKNAILIVEFTTTYQRKGMSILKAAITGSGERFRAVLMTALTFILGVMPMIFATGAGATSQISMGTTVFFGMIAATLIGVIFVPAFFTFFDSIALYKKVKKTGKTISVIAVCLISSFVLKGCMLGPDYEQPTFFTERQTEQALGAPLSNDLSAPAFDLSDLNDPILDKLCAMANENNPSLRSALFKIRQARALLHIQQASLFPTLDAAAKYNYVKESKNMGLVYDEDYYQLGFDAGWEIDLFGGTRRKIEAQQANLAATLYSVKNIRISLFSEIAANYFNLRTTEMLLKKTRENVALQQKNKELIQEKFATGLVNELDVKQATYILENTRADIPQLEQQRAIYQNALALLVGELPETLNPLLSSNQNGMAKYHADFNKDYLKLPASVLRNRPDVKAAEQQLIAQNALIGSAIADLFPKVSFSTLFGFESLHFKDLIKSNSYGYNYLPEITTPIFHFGALWENITAQKALKQVQVESYKQTMLSAAHEIRNALIAIQQEQMRNKQLYKSYREASDVAELTMDQYINGLISYADVIDTEERRLSAQTNWIQSNGTLYQNLISFYKSTGGHMNSFD